MKHINKIILVLALVFFWSYNSMSQGCSQCKLLSEQGAELNESSFGNNLNMGILFLMIIPYLLLSFLFREQIGVFFKKTFFNKS
jgi:hypothetical protein